MERFRLILTVIILLSFPLMVNAQSNIYEKYNDKPNISSVYISKTMLEMQPRVNTQDINISKVAGQLDAVYILSTFDNTIKRSLRTDLNDFIKKGKYEVLMKQQGTVGSSSFYVKKKGDKIKELVMITDGAAKLSYIHLVGEMTLQDIQRITNSQRLSYNFPGLPEIIRSNIQDIDLSWLENYIQYFQASIEENFENYTLSL